MRLGFFRLSPDDYAGLHQRYAKLLGVSDIRLSTINSPLDKENAERVRALFEPMMRALYNEKGSSFRIEILQDKPVQDFIEAHAAALDSSFRQVKMSDAMRRRLQRSDYIFSGFKTFHELNEAFPSLIDENGNRKPFERFLNDVRKIDATYNRNYLRAEYNFASASAEMAARWEQFMEDGDRYNLQYRTAGDGRVRPEHAALHGVTLPIDDPFWEEFYPPNGWNCRCSVVQVRKSKYSVTPHDEAMALGEQATGRDTRRMFRFNPGKEQQTFPDYNPYTISKCRNCDIASKLAKGIPDNQLCQGCMLLQRCYEQLDEVIKHGNGEIRINRNVNREDSDYKKLYQIAEYFANKGEIVELTPKMSRPPKFKYECIYGDLIGTKYENKCPDLRIGGKWYEHEGFISDNPKRAFSNMVNHGLKQSGRIIIDKPNLTDRYMLHNLIVRATKELQDITEVWLLEDAQLRLLYKKAGD